MKPGAEQQRGLLQPEEFDVDDLDSARPENGNEAYARNRRTRAPPRWSRRKYVLWGLVAVAALLVAGTALNKGAGIKIPKWRRPTDVLSYEDPPLPPKEGPTHPKLPPDPEPPTSPKAPTPPFSPSAPISLVESSPFPSLSSFVESSPSLSPSSLVEPSTSLSFGASPTSVANISAGVKTWEKPTDFKIIGLVFFGRPAVVAILDCYLRRNLVSNGGWLDEVQFVVNTPNEDDIGWLDVLVDDEELYKKVTKPELGFNHIWELVEPEHMYIKIDDDIVFFSDNAIPDIVWSKLNNTNSFNVVANLVNSPLTGFLHYRLGAIHSYLPELQPPKDAAPESLGPTAWRASRLPEWHEKNMEWPFAGVGAGKDDNGSALPTDMPGAPPFKGHRWLPLPDNEDNLHNTPMKDSTYDPNGPDWQSWSLGAQKHYSLLQNLEKDELDRYHYGWGNDLDRERIWNMMYLRMNINFMAIWGKDVLDNLPFETMDDERELSVTVPVKLGRPLLINTKAIAAHFAFRSQIEMHDTDLLDRYRAYANEKICAKDNQIPYQQYRTGNIKYSK